MTLAEILAMPAVQAKLREAYQEGWEASREGWNAEYPGNAEERDCWKTGRDEAIANITGARNDRP